jgi:hypothetical protein
MSFLDQVGGILNSPLAQSFLSPAPSPAPAPAPVIIQSPATAAMKPGMDTSTIAMIAGGVLAVVAVLYFAFKK